MAAAALVPAPAPAAEWLAGDLHVHTCFSHDAWCPPTDDNTGPETFYAVSLDPEARFRDAAARGLDFLAITDHEDVRSQSHPGFGAAGVIGVPAYEASLRGHAQPLGATAVYDGPEDAAAVNAFADDLRSRGGALQANHPGYRQEQEFTGCGDVAALDWEYGYEVRPDAIEAWNPTAPVQTALAFLDCWLARGARVAVTGGSDSHWASVEAVAGPGQPTTWVLANERSAAGVIGAIRAGRTTISREPPALGGGRLVLEGDADRDGVYEAQVGDAVPPGAPVRVRVEGALAGLLYVRTAGASIRYGAPLGPGRAISFRAPATGWMRAELLAVPAQALPPRCDPRLADSASLCPYDHALLALTSPLYVGPR
jgi:hypothetical protein